MKSTNLFIPKAVEPADASATQPMFPWFEPQSIKYPAFLKKIHSFKGLQWGRVQPIDVDMMLLLGGRIYLFGEGKHTNGKLHDRQRYFLEALCDAINTAGTGKLACAFTYRHGNDDPVDVAVCPVDRVYHTDNPGHRDTKWLPPPDKCTVKEFIEALAKAHAIDLEDDK